MKASLLVDAPILDKKRIWVKKVYKPYFDHDFHFHKTYEFSWIAEGSGKIIAGDHLGHFEKGELLMLGLGLPHILRCDPEFYVPKPKKFTTAYSIYFTSDFITGMTDEPNMLTSLQNLLKKSERGFRVTGEAKKTATLITKKIIEAEGFEQLGLFMQLLHLLSHTNDYTTLASTTYKLLPSETDMNRFVEVYDFLFKNFQRQISLAEVAGICSMTTNAFCRFFKTKTQKTFVRFLTEIRIGHACKLLQDENQNIKNLCYDCGFNNPVFFFRSFKKITGKTPMAYRKSILEINET